VDEQHGTLDIGYGMGPDWIGKGLGRVFVTAIVEFALTSHRRSSCVSSFSAGISARGR
jgi:RimJ/RimL family protein N-acetyltransferase